MDIQLIKISPEEIGLLQEISVQTFHDTFSSQNKEEDMQSFLAEHFTEEKLMLETKNPFSAFYFAKIENNITGYLKTNFASAQTELQNNDALEIERIYVLQEYQGKRIGQFMLDKAIELATQHSMKYVWLGVWEKNEKAIRFYEKNGFVKFGTHVFKLGNDEQTDIMMKLELN